LALRVATAPWKALFFPHFAELAGVLQTTFFGAAFGCRA
jgi:hypothetical protein